MASRTSLRLIVLSPCSRVFFNLSSRSSSSSSSYSKVYFLSKNNNPRIRNCSARTTGAGSSLPPPDVANLAQTARISLAPNEVEEFASKIRQASDATLVFPPRMSKLNAIDNLLANWKPRFGLLQGVDLDSVEPAIRADTVHDNLSEDITEKFENREEIIASIPKVMRIHTSKFPKYRPNQKSDSPWLKELKCTYNLAGPERSLFEMERQE